MDWTSSASTNDQARFAKRGIRNQFFLLATTVALTLCVGSFFQKPIHDYGLAQVNGIVSGITMIVWGLLAPRIMKALGRDDGLAMKNDEVRRSIIYSLLRGSGIFGAQKGAIGDILAMFLSRVWCVDLGSGPTPRTIPFFPIDFLARAIMFMGIVVCLISAFLAGLAFLSLQT